MRKKLILRKIKKGKKEKIKKWFKKLSNNLSEKAKNSLKEENILKENTFLVEIEDESYVAWYVEHKENLKGPNMNKKINKKHKRVLNECLEERKIEGKQGYQLSVEK